MRAKMILLFVGVLVMTLSFVGNADAAFKDQQPKGPAVFHSLADGNTILTDTAGLVCTWWRQLWQCGNLYHIIEYRDNNDGKISVCDYIKVELTEAFGQPVTPPIESWLHIEWVTLTLKLRKIGFSDSMFVEFSGGMDSLFRVVGNDPVCTWWHEVWPNECTWRHMHSWHDNGNETLDSCDYVDFAIGPPEVWHVVAVYSVGDSTYIDIEPQMGGEHMVLNHYFSPTDTVVGRPVCTIWHEEEPEYCNWWHITDWTDNGSDELDSCDIIVITPVEVWHVEDIATDIWVVHQDPPGYGIPTMTEWGLVILVALLLASAVFIYVRRKRIMVSP